MIRTHTLQAVLSVADTDQFVASRTVVALPPSDLDPSEGEMRVRINGVEYIRHYDPEV